MPLTYLPLTKIHLNLKERYFVCKIAFVVVVAVVVKINRVKYFHENIMLFQKIKDAKDKSYVIF